MAHPSLAHTAHRPWPLPTQAWTWRQTWCDLLFAHWPVPAELLRPLIPDELELQTYDGQAWLGVVPFRMEGVMRRPLPDLPWISAFPELNVRTYVERDGKAGVWFFSLDATQPLAVWAAKTFFDLPYHRARMVCEPDGQDIVYRSERRTGDARFAGRYGPAGDVFLSEPGTLEHFLTERYCLFAKSRSGRSTITEVHHEPWPLQPAHAEILEQSMHAPLGVELPDAAPHLLFVRRIDVAVWSPRAI